MQNLDDKTRNAVQTYADLFNRTTASVVEEALTDWMDTVGAARIEIAREREAQTA